MNSIQSICLSLRPARDFLIFYAASWVFLLVHVGREWWINPQYGFGLFVPLFCIGILWKRQSELSKFITDKNRLNFNRHFKFLFFGLGVMVFPVELLHLVSPYLRTLGYGVFFACVGLTIFALRVLGFSKIPSVVWGVFILFLTAVPWPSVVELEVGQFLMRQVTKITAEILNFFGVLAISRGNLIELKQGMVSINEACSGIRSLQSCLMMGVGLSQFFCMSHKKAAGFVGIALVLAFGGNLIRTLILSYAAAKEGSQGVTTVHDPAGWLILVSVTVLLYGIAHYMEGASTDQEACPLPQLPWDRLKGFRGVLVLGVIMFSLAHFWFWMGTYLSSPQKKPTFALRASDDVSVVLEPVDSVTKSILLNPQTSFMAKGESKRWGKFSAYTFFWEPGPDAQISFFHRPDVCMPGVGWRMLLDSTTIDIPIGNRKTQWYLFEFERDQQKILQAWGVWRDGREEWVDFSSSWKGLVGVYRQRWAYIWRGQQNSNTEIISILMDAQHANQEALKGVIQELFVLNDEKALIPRK